MVDNCYGEFVEISEPSEYGADMIVGSLIKNPGGGLATSGGYICGTRECIERCAYRLNAPGLGKEVGTNMGMLRGLYQGLFLAPTVVAGALKGAVFAVLLCALLTLALPYLKADGEPLPPETLGESRLYGVLYEENPVAQLFAQE